MIRKRNGGNIKRDPVQAGKKTNTLGITGIMARRMSTGILLPGTPINMLVPGGKINYISFPRLNPMVNKQCESRLHQVFCRQ